MTYSSKEKMRLQKFIAHSGYCSRRKAETLIEQGKVKVNGKKVTEMGVLVDDSDFVEVEGNTLTRDTNFVYYLLNKPCGVLSTADDEFNRDTVIQGLPDDKRIYPVGRLDKESTGAIILTNDGTFTHYMTHPSYDLEKHYRVSVDGLLDYDVINLLKEGITIDGVSYQGVIISNVKQIKGKNRTTFNITLHEGKNRQIRKIFEHFNLPVLKLHRFALGPIDINDLSIGEYRKLSNHEVKKLLLSAKGIL